ncbi:DUF4279 domain-containing protein [Paenibacillus sp. Soil787]|uniref:DUF4279 domain-containing protein n=1 Tax=Paenibacillus sp. Soil787 TaxID=1736411 RepID=UPI0009E7CEB7|nr:DUF4279 domain-containing protein [Paenibacillus sp. Soil787]
MPDVRSSRARICINGGRKETAWELSSDYQESCDVKVQLDQILEPLKNKATIINHLKSKFRV